MVKIIKEKMFISSAIKIEELGLKRNPFDPDPLIGEPDLFVGREKERKDFAIALEEGTNILLIANAGMGKTSLCNLARLAYADDYVWGFTEWNPKSPRQTIIKLLSDIINREYYIYTTKSTEIPKEVKQIVGKIEKFRQSPVNYPMMEIIKDIKVVGSVIDKPTVTVIDNFYKFEKNASFFDTFLCAITEDSTFNSIICCTLPECIEKLKEESMGLYQRLSGKIELERFSEDELKEIIKRRVESVWIRKVEKRYHPFTEEAINIIAENADGNARDAIIFAQTAIRDAIIAELKFIDKSFTLLCIRKLKKTLTQRWLHKYGEPGRKIITHLIKSDGKICMKELKEEMKVKSNESIMYYLNRLIEDELVERVGRGKYKIPLKDEFKPLLDI